MALFQLKLLSQNQWLTLNLACFQNISVKPIITVVSDYLQSNYTKTGLPLPPSLPKILAIRRACHVIDLCASVLELAFCDHAVIHLMLGWHNDKYNNAHIEYWTTIDLPSNRKWGYFPSWSADFLGQTYVSHVVIITGYSIKISASIVRVWPSPSLCLPFPPLVANYSNLSFRWSHFGRCLRGHAALA